MSGKLDFDTIEIISIEAYHNDEYQGLEWELLNMAHRYRHLMAETH
jgi:hypothetical protein